MTKKRKRKIQNKYIDIMLLLLHRDELNLRYPIHNSPRLNESECITDMYGLNLHDTST